MTDGSGSVAVWRRQLGFTRPFGAGALLRQRFLLVDDIISHTTASFNHNMIP